MTPYAKPKEEDQKRNNRRKWYLQNKERILEEYRARKLKEFADKVLENVKDPIR